YRFIAYRGFESPSLRQNAKARNMRAFCFVWTFRYGDKVNCKSAPYRSSLKSMRPARAMTGFQLATAIAAGRRSGAAFFDMTEGNASFAEIVWRHFDGDFVSGEDADMIFLHLAGCVGNQLMSVFEIDAKTRVGQ